MPFTDDRNLEKPSDGASNAGESINDNSDKLEIRTIRVVLGEAIAQYASVYIDHSVDKVKEAKADADGTKFALGILLGGGVLNDEDFVQVGGRLTNVGWSFSTSDQIWVSDTVAGGLVQVKPAKATLIGKRLTATAMLCMVPVNMD